MLPECSAMNTYPDVDLCAVIFLSFKQLWRGIRRTTTVSAQQCTRLEQITEAKVYNSNEQAVNQDTSSHLRHRLLAAQPVIMLNNT